MGVPLVHGESPSVRAALLAVTADLPAMRKVTQFLGHKADLGCSRCKFRAEREPGTIGASGRMCYFTPHSSAGRSHEEVVQQAQEFKDASTRYAARATAQKNGVRYSELVRLPYFDIVRMVTTDPMHTFLLGMVKRETELNLELLSSQQREEFVRRVKSVRIPYDVGRLPNNMFDHGEGMSGVTAAQWKTYIICYARPCLYKLLPVRPYKCMVLLSEIVSIISSPVFTEDLITSLYRLLQDHHHLFCQVYGKWAITVNYHMGLHLPDIILDLGPPQSFWCFSYERMNGILAGTPNSNRCIEVEVANRFVRDISFSNCNIPIMNATNDIPKILRDFVYPDDDEMQQPPYPQTLWVRTLLSGTSDDRLELQMLVDRGDVSDWPIELKHPCKLNVRIKGAIFTEIRTFFEGLYGNDLEYIQPRIHKYGRCMVNGQHFSSDFNSTDRGSVVKSMFVIDDGEIAPYFGIVRFYFKITTVVQHESKTHHLAYVSWLKFKSSRPEPLSNLYEVTKQLYLKDRIISPRRFLCRCVLVSPNTSLSVSLVSELPK